MISISEEKNCCGCGVCREVCPNNCISMTEKTLGHLFPEVEPEKCMNCGLCENVCPVHGPSPVPEKFEQRVYAAYAEDAEARFAGSFGGIFGILANELLKEGYAVYGAAFDDSLKLRCTLAENGEELRKLYKSKYLQSDMTGKYAEISSRLEHGDKVFFISTPCQVSALKRYLGRDFDNLFTADFFCHGVPSQRFFDECIAEEGKRRKGRIVRYAFRTKISSGVTPHYFTETLETDGSRREITQLYFKSPFYALFQRYVTLRESCYDCRFAGKNRGSDITLGDFHEINRYVKDVNRFDGVSTVVVNSRRGEMLWEACASSVHRIPMDMEKLTNDGVCFGNGMRRPEIRDEFLRDYEQMTVGELIDKWAAPRMYLKNAVYYKLPTFMRKALKCFFGV